MVQDPYWNKLLRYCKDNRSYQPATSAGKKGSRQQFKPEGGPPPKPEVGAHVSRQEGQCKGKLPKQHSSGTNSEGETREGIGKKKEWQRVTAKKKKA